jgi:hypothetical protein
MATQLINRMNESGLSEEFAVDNPSFRRLEACETAESWRTATKVCATISRFRL